MRNWLRVTATCCLAWGFSGCTTLPPVPVVLPPLPPQPAPVPAECTKAAIELYPPYLHPLPAWFGSVPVNDQLRALATLKLADALQYSNLRSQAERCGR